MPVQSQRETQGTMNRQPQSGDGRTGSPGCCGALRVVKPRGGRAPPSAVSTRVCLRELLNYSIEFSPHPSPRSGYPRALVLPLATGPAHAHKQARTRARRSHARSDGGAPARTEHAPCGLSGAPPQGQGARPGRRLLRSGSAPWCWSRWSQTC